MPHGGKRPGVGARKKPESQKQQVISVSLPPKTLAKLNQYALKHHKGRSWIVDMAISKFMEEHSPDDIALRARTRHELD
jgi:metal-responsive CopG/Arc/MetJ family transcriptional regulator